MKDRKRRVELYSFYDHTGMERHLERMAGKGWFLEKIENNFWHYRRLQPQKLRYFVTYFPKAGELDPEPSEEQKTFYDFCEHTGWKLAASSAQLQIFYNENPDAVSIATDPQLELDTLGRSARRSFIPVYSIFLAVSLLFACMFVSELKSDPVGLLADATGLHMGFVFCLLLVFCVSELGGYFSWYVKARKAAVRGEFLETVSHICLTKAVLALMLLSFLFWLLSRVSAGPLWSRSITVIICVYMACILFLGGVIKVFLRKRGVSSGANRMSVLAVTFLVSMIFFTALIHTGVQIAGNSRNPDREDAAARSASFSSYMEEPPLEIGDLTEASPTLYITSRTGSDSLILGRFELSVQPRTGDYGLPHMEYTVTQIKAPLLYDFCRKTLLRDAVRSHGETGSFDELKDPASWGAQKAYQFTGKDRERMNWYLLCYPNRIVQIWFSWTPSERQKETVGERLS